MNSAVLFSGWSTLAEGPRIAGLNITVGVVPEGVGHDAGTSSGGSGWPFRKVMVWGTVAKVPDHGIARVDPELAREEAHQVDLARREARVHVIGGGAISVVVGGRDRSLGRVDRGGDLLQQAGDRLPGLGSHLARGWVLTDGSTTLIQPAISLPCTMQSYSKLPALVNVSEKLVTCWPGRKYEGSVLMIPEFA